MKADRTTLVATMEVPHCGQERMLPAAPLLPRLALAVLLNFSAITHSLHYLKILLDTKKAAPARAGTAKNPNNTLQFSQVKRKSLKIYFLTSLLIV